MRRILLIVGGAVVVGLVIYLAQPYIFKSAGPSERPIGTDAPVLEVASRTLPVAPLPITETAQTENNRITAVGEREILTYWFDAGDHALHLFTAAGDLLRIDQDGEETRLFALGGPQVSSVTPSLRGDAVIIETGYPNKQLFSALTLANRKTVFLPNDTTAAAWSPTGGEIALIRRGDAPKKITPGIYRFALATGKSQLIAAATFFDSTIVWPRADAVYISTRFSGPNAASVWQLNLQSKTLSQALPDAIGLLTRWSPDGKRVLVYTQEQPRIRVFDGQLLSSSATGIDTLPNKCAFVSSTKLICAAPSTRKGKIDPSLYLSRESYSEDSLLTLEWRGGTWVPSAVFDGWSEAPSFDMLQPQVSGGSAYFINRQDNRLYSILLDQE